MHPQIIHCGEAPKSMPFKYFVKKKQVLRGSFGEILLIQIQLFPQTSFEAELGSFNFKNEVSAYGLGLVVQLS